MCLQYSNKKVKDYLYNNTMKAQCKYQKVGTRVSAHQEVVTLKQTVINPD